MTLSALQGRMLARLVEDVRTLLAQGEAPSSTLRALEAVRATGLWTEHGEVAVARPAVVTLIDRLPNPGEAQPAVLSLVPEVRDAWLRVVRARLSEMGERGDVAALTEAITHAGALASELVGVQAPSLAATPFGELERAVLTTPAHEAPAFPVLLRVLAATAALTSDPTPVTLPTALPEVAYDDPQATWRPGRLLRLPASDGDRDDDGGVERRARGAVQRRRRHALGAASPVGVPAGAAHVHQGVVGGRARVGRHRLRAGARARLAVSEPAARRGGGDLAERRGDPLRLARRTLPAHPRTARRDRARPPRDGEHPRRQARPRHRGRAAARRVALRARLGRAATGLHHSPVVLRRLLPGAGQPGVLPAGLAGDRRHPPRRRGLGQGAHGARRRCNA